MASGRKTKAAQTLKDVALVVVPPPPPPSRLVVEEAEELAEARGLASRVAGHFPEIPFPPLPEPIQTLPLPVLRHYKPRQPPPPRMEVNGISEGLGYASSKLGDLFSSRG